MSTYTAANPTSSVHIAHIAALIAEELTITYISVAQPPPRLAEMSVIDLQVVFANARDEVSFARM